MGVLLCLIVLATVREPLFITAPRIWAEEGNVYLAAALERGIWPALFEPHLWYYSLLPNLAGAVAAMVPDLRLAAHISTGASFLVQLWIAYIVFTTPGRFSQSHADRTILAAALFLVSNTEIWLNTITLQFWLAAGTFFILNAARLRAMHVAYLAVAFTTGAPSLFFAPWFLLRAWRERSRISAAVCAVALFASLVQMTSLYIGLQDQVVSRFDLAGLAHFPRAVFATAIRPLVTLGSSLPQIIGTTVIVGGVFGSIVWAACKRRDADPWLWGIAPLALYTLLAIVSSLEMSGGARYGFPVALATLAMALTSWTQLFGPWRAYDLTAILLALKLPGYFDTKRFYDPAWTSWVPAVEQACRANSEDVAIFPQWDDAKWSMRLPAARCVHITNGP